jgi:hypothetical protein
MSYPMAAARQASLTGIHRVMNRLVDAALANIFPLCPP